MSAGMLYMSLISLLQHMFDDVTTSVIISNHVSSPQRPTTGVLQGSVLCPSLYSVYINTLPVVLCDAATPLTTRLSTPPTPPHHSFNLGYRWSPSKCAVINAPAHRPMTLNDEDLPTVEEFVYLGLPFQKAGLSTAALINHRTRGSIGAMATLQTIGARPPGFSAILSAPLYKQFIRPKFEYGLAISRLQAADSTALERL